MICITATELQKSFGENTVLSQIGFELREGERVGLIGRNGSGKSTLFRLLSGELLPDGGSVSVAPGLRMEVLEQIPRYAAGTAVEQVIRSGFAPLHAMEEELGRLRKQMEEDSSSALLRRYDALHARYESLGGYEQDVQFARVISGLRFEKEFLTRTFETLSGGEKTKVNLARIMLASPDILLLDEPTNHLDLIYQKQIFALISDWLKTPGRAVVSVVHDLSLAKAYGTHALLLNRGKTAAYGDAAAVMRAETLNAVYGMDVAEWMRTMLGQWNDV